ncbi:unnamed protein product [Lactuca virosa]|uniref:Uncharacterized protein n=1 Tax=Lactuca virosa TaxID=75947 RepID=A0AAU9NUZ3_9ASTR|nr:unnamed protein product [Lactuca virosa]
MVQDVISEKLRNFIHYMATFVSGFLVGFTTVWLYNSLWHCLMGKKVAKLLGCTSWLGAGPGLMDAATRDALEAGKSVGGFNIAKETGEWTVTNFHPYLPSHAYLTCRFFSARKHGLMDAVVRIREDRIGGLFPKERFPPFNAKQSLCPSCGHTIQSRLRG